MKGFEVHTNNTKYIHDERGVLFEKDTSKNKIAVIQYPIADGNNSYIIPTTVTIINQSAFAQAEKLKTITLPDGLTEIQPYAFELSGLTSITITKEVITIGQYPLRQCSSLSNISVITGNTNYKIENGALIETKGDVTKLVIYPQAKSDQIIYKIPEEVLIIDGYAFYGQTHLKYIQFNSKLTTINEYAFNGMTQLRTITLPSTITKINKEAFTTCISLKYVIMKERTTDITLEADSKVFDENSELKIYTVKDYPSDTTICGITPERVIMEYGNDTETIEWIYKTDKTLFIYGIGKMKEYSETATKTWNTKKEDCEHIEIDENIETITKQSFKDFIKVQDIRIPTTVNTIGEYILR